jgi:hypothetical protein
MNIEKKKSATRGVLTMMKHTTVFYKISYDDDEEEEAMEEAEESDSGNTTSRAETE